MLKYSIRKKPTFVTALDNLSSRWADKKRCGWTKVEFITWFENNVRGKFKQGDLITWKHTPELPNVVPYIFDIVYINELHYNVDMDKLTNEPCVLHCKSTSKAISYRCPAEMRLLTEKELALVNLQNTKAQGSA
jgi:hypothetical protein